MGLIVTDAILILTCNLVFLINFIIYVQIFQFFNIQTSDVNIQDVEVKLRM